VSDHPTGYECPICGGPMDPDDQNPVWLPVCPSCGSGVPPQPVDETDEPGETG
jgi:hypothetical protein